MKYIFQIAVLSIILPFFTHYNLTSQIQRVVAVKIEAHLPTHLFQKSHSPTFELNIKSKRTVRGKFYVGIKKITEKKFHFLNEEKIKLNRGTSSFKLKLPVNWQAGFYEIFARVVTGDYEYFSDTLTFAYQSDSILYSPTNPVDFETFWLNTFSTLDTINPYFELTEHPDEQQDSIKVFKLMYRSLDTMCIKAWYCFPKTDKLLPAILILPSYGNTSILIPIRLAKLGFAVLAIQIHGLDVEFDEYPAGDDPSAGLNLDTPDRYYLRSAVASSMRAIDFFYTRSEVDTARICVAGTSQGGGLALLLTGLDSRIGVTVATTPTLCCFPEGIESGCCSRVRRSINNGLIDKTTALRTLSYFDANNFAERLTKPVLLSTHFKDRISAPNTVFALYNRIPSRTKQLIIHSNLGHEFPVNHWDVPYSWLSVVLRKK